VSKKARFFGLKGCISTPTPSLKAPELYSPNDGISNLIMHRKRVRVGSGHSLHNEERSQVSPRRLPVFERKRDPDIAAGGGEAGLYAVFGLQASDFIEKTNRVDR